MLNLLKRDLKLHWCAMVLPYVIVMLVMGAIVISNPDSALAVAVTMGALVIPFLPMAIHLRENSQGTLADLVALPGSRKALVSLRYIEALLFSAVMVSLAHLDTWSAQSAAAHRFVPFDVLDRTGFALTTMPLLICFAYPMPFTLRWNGKGLAVAFAILYVLILGIIGLMRLFPLKEHVGYSRAFARFVMYLMDHPGQATSGFLALFLVLFSVSYLLSLKAFSSREF